MLSHNFQMPQKYVACRDNPLNQALLVLSRKILFWDISWKDNIFLKRKPESWFGLEHISTPWLCNIEWQLCHYAKSLQAVRGRKNYIHPFISNVLSFMSIIYIYNMCIYKGITIYSQWMFWIIIWSFYTSSMSYFIYLRALPFPIVWQTRTLYTILLEVSCSPSSRHEEIK